MTAPSATNRGVDDLDVLFVGHEASRTGAPVMLLHLLRWLRAHTDLRFALVLLDGGPLLADYRAVTDTTVLGGEGGGEALGAGHRDAPLVYCNGVKSVAVLERLGERTGGRRVLTHVHELEQGLRMSLTDDELRSMLECTHHWVAASDLVAHNLVERHGVEPAAVSRHYEFIDVALLEGRAHPSTEARATLREQLGAPPGSAIVGTMGSTEWRKGPDLFVTLAALLGDGPPAHLVWVGADPSRPETGWLRGQVRAAGLDERVHVVGVDADPGRWLALFDVFVLTSREDPFPLVCLESSLLGVPVVCFANTGIAEFAGDGEYGVTVPYLDLAAMADEVAALLDDPVRRRALGARASARVRADFDVEVAAPALLATIEGCGR